LRVYLVFTGFKQDYIQEYFLNKTTVTEHQIASRIAKTIDPNTNDTTDDPLVQLRLRQKSKWIDNLIIHYTHEARLAGYNVTKTLVHSRPHYKSASLPTINKQQQ
jgi:hypothetical protein